MQFLPELFANNREWAAQQAGRDPTFFDRLCELSVRSQVRTLSRLPTIVDAWAAGRRLIIHGWIYDLHDGLLRDLEVSVDRPAP